MNCNEIVLNGCSPTPLGKYLAALGVHRVVGEQADPHARMFWQNDHAILKTSISKDELVEFILERYRPTPIIAPWNSGSGFYKSVDQTAIRSIYQTTAPRLENYGNAVIEGQKIIKVLGWIKPVTKAKSLMLNICRSSMSDEVVNWLDAAFVLTVNGLKSPPLLGSGGNDGRQDFTYNFMQRICDVMDPVTGIQTPNSKDWLVSCLFGDYPRKLVRDAAIGQFYPSAAGGVNSARGFESSSLTNPWDFILLIEGALVFSSGLVKKLESFDEGALSYPFTVKPSGVGYGSASSEDEKKRRQFEMWLPLWNQPTSVPELKALFSEGRANVNGRKARNGIDFARAVATLGVDRGISTFIRTGFMIRNGKNHFSVPLGRYEVGESPPVRLLDEIDRWLVMLHVRTNAESPASVRKAKRALDEAIIGMCKDNHPAQVQNTLIALGDCEAALVKSISWANDKKIQIRPIPFLSSAWIEQADDGSTEFRLALSLAMLKNEVDEISDHRSESIRFILEPVKLNKRVLMWNPDRRCSPLPPGNPIDALNVIFSRRLVRGLQDKLPYYPDISSQNASFEDINAFINGRTDDGKIIELLKGLMLVHSGRKSDTYDAEYREDSFPGAAYALLKLCYSGKGGKDEVPILPEIHRRAHSGDLRSATALASRRVRGSIGAPYVQMVEASPSFAKRIAASMLFPISKNNIAELRERLTEPKEVV